MKSKIKNVKVIYPENTEEFNRRVAEVIAKIIIERISIEEFRLLEEKLKNKNNNLL